MADQPAGDTPDQRSLAEQLLVQRQAARSAGDFTAADAFRGQIEHLGYLVVDTAEGPQLQVKPAFATIDVSRGFPSYAYDAEVAVTVIVDGWLADVREFVDALMKHESASLHLLLVDATNDGESAAGLENLAQGDSRISVVHLAQPAGWADIHTAAAAACQAQFYALADMSTIFDCPILSLCVQQLQSNTQVIAAGWRGANVDLADDWRSVIDAGSGPCDVLLSYLLVVPASLARAVPPHPRARFYRNADIEWSLRLRQHVAELHAAQGPPGQAAPAPLMIALGPEAPAHQSRHHGFHDSEPQMRDRESKKTYDRILKTFRGRTDLLAR